LDQLVDPAIMPKVIYTYPPMNSQGPYDEFPLTYQHIEIRFNKIMERSSIRRAVRLSAPNSLIRIDSLYFYTNYGDEYLAYPVGPTPYPQDLLWEIGASYRLEVDTSALDVNGNRLLPAFSTTFTPEPFFRVMSAYPRNGAVGVQTDELPQVVFNSKVDESILSLLQISPALPNAYFRYFYDSTRIDYAHPGAPFANSTTYTVTIPAAAHDKAGNYLQSPLSVSFTTAPFAVFSTYPPNGATQVGIGDPVLVNMTGLVDSATVRQAFSISPAVPGVLNAYSASPQFGFTPRVGFASLTTYTVTISSMLKSLGGDPLSSPYQYSFTTESFRVIYTDPAPNATGVARSSWITVSFNAQIDTGSVRNAFSISPPVASGFQMQDRTSYFYFAPTGPLAARTTYTVTLATSMGCKSGGGLQSPYSFSFTTGDF